MRWGFLGMVTSWAIESVKTRLELSSFTFSVVEEDGHPHAAKRMEIIKMPVKKAFFFINFFKAISLLFQLISIILFHYNENDNQYQFDV